MPRTIRWRKWIAKQNLDKGIDEVRVHYIKEMLAAHRYAAGQVEIVNRTLRVLSDLGQGSDEWYPSWRIRLQAGLDQISYGLRAWMDGVVVEENPDSYKWRIKPEYHRAVARAIEELDQERRRAAA